MARVTFDQINIVAADVDASLAFYRRLGVDIPDARVWRTASGPHHASAATSSTDENPQLDIDSATFAQCWNGGWKGRVDLGGRVVVGFRVATRAGVDEVYEDLVAAGYRGLQEPFDAFWGARYAIIEDPDGLAVGLMSPISDEMRSPPPAV